MRRGELVYDPFLGSRDDPRGRGTDVYLGPVKSALWAAAAGHLIRDEATLMPAVREIAKQLGRPVREVLRECLFEHQHDELMDRFYGIDKLTQEDLEEEWRRDRILMELDHRSCQLARPVPGAPIDPEKLAYESPKAMIKRIAKNILIDHLRKLKSRGDGLDDEYWKSLKISLVTRIPKRRSSLRRDTQPYLAGLAKYRPCISTSRLDMCEPVQAGSEEEA